MEQGANCPTAGGRFAFAPITRRASHSYRRRTRRTASEVRQLRGEGFLRRNACAALRLKLTPNAIRGLNGWRPSPAV